MAGLLFRGKQLLGTYRLPTTSAKAGQEGAAGLARGCGSSHSRPRTVKTMIQHELHERMGTARLFWMVSWCQGPMNFSLRWAQEIDALGPESLAMVKGLAFSEAWGIASPCHGEQNHRRKRSPRARGDQA